MLNTVKKPKHASDAARYHRQDDETAPVASQSTQETAAPEGRVDPELEMVSITFEVRKLYAPALRSAIEEISNEVGGRLEGPHTFAKERALTDAVIALGELRKSVNAAIPAGDPYYS